MIFELIIRECWRKARHKHSSTLHDGTGQMPLPENSVKCEEVFWNVLEIFLWSEGGEKRPGGSDSGQRDVISPRDSVSTCDLSLFSSGSTVFTLIFLKLINTIFYTPWPPKRRRSWRVSYPHAITMSSTKHSV